MHYDLQKINCFDLLTPSGGCGCIKGQNICLHCVLCFIAVNLTCNMTTFRKEKLEDLKVLKRSPDLLNNVKIRQGQLRLIIETLLFCFTIYGGGGFFGQVT